MIVLNMLALSILLIWQVVVAVALLLLVRQVTVLSIRSGLTPVDEPPQTELAAGQPVDSKVLDRLPDSRQAGAMYLVWLTATCLACRDLADELVHSSLPDHVTVLLTGSAREIAKLSFKVPAAVTLLDGEVAATIVEALNLRAAPYVVELESGRITGWTQAQSVADIWRLVRARETSNATTYAAMDG